MLVKRTLVALLLLPFGLAAIFFGGLVFDGLIALIIVLAAWEYVRLFRTGGFQPAGVFTIAGSAVLVLFRARSGFESEPWLLVLATMVTLIPHLAAYERGRIQAATDYTITLTGLIYFGWLGAYLVSLRHLPQGQWWLLLVLVAVWLADTGAYLIGKPFGRHRLAPRLSPKKSWEGYLGGIAISTLGTPLLVALHASLAPQEGLPVSFEQAALLGLLISTITTLGDLGESMIKRQVGQKDSSHLLPGHGGIFDRIDSWLWAAPLGYYFIIWWISPI